MRHKSQATNELQHDGESDGPKFRFTVADLLVFAAAVPICIGVVEAIEVTATMQAYDWFGWHWHGNVRRFLAYDVGIPVDFVTGYVTFALNSLPAWVCYAVVAATLGLVRNKWAYISGIVFIASIFVRDLMSDYFIGWLTFFNFRVVSLFGVAMVACCFTAARCIRGRFGDSNRSVGRVGMGLTCAAIVVCVAVSTYGWWQIAIERQTGPEIQKSF